MFNINDEVVIGLSSIVFRIIAIEDEYSINYFESTIVIPKRHKYSYVATEPYEVNPETGVIIYVVMLYEFLPILLEKINIWNNSWFIRLCLYY